MEEREPTIRDGIRAGLPMFLPTLMIGLSFGVFATPIIGGFAATVMSTIVFGGSAQVAAVGVLQGGGSVVAAILPGILLNLRFLPMSLAIGPSLRGSRSRRAAEGQAIVDASFAISAGADGHFHRGLLLGSWVPQAFGWIGGTLIGAIVGGVLPDPAELGVDAIFPAFFLSLLAGEVRGAPSRRPLVVIALSVAITLALLPWAPAGIPVIAGSAAALIGLARR
jgi:predicted branched-subunit amino acid permease